MLWSFFGIRDSGFGIRIRIRDSGFGIRIRDRDSRWYWPAEQRVTRNLKKIKESSRLVVVIPSYPYFPYKPYTPYFPTSIPLFPPSPSSLCCAGRSESAGLALHWVRDPAQGILFLISLLRSPPLLATQWSSTILAVRSPSGPFPPRQRH